VTQRVLVTGAGGFVGRALTLALAADGVDVEAVGRGGRPAWLPVSAGWHRCDLLAPSAATSLVDAVTPDAVVHLAWETTPPGYWTSTANAAWLAASLELVGALAALPGSPRRLVTAGTCAEYDWLQPGPFDERRSPIGPATRYGAAKRTLGETAEASGLSAAHARLFYLYGPGEHPARLVPTVAGRLLRGERAPTTHGRQQRDYLYVQDAARALVALTHAIGVTGSVNVASGVAIPVADLVNAVADEIGRPDLVGWGEVPLAATEPERIVANVRRLRDEVGFRPSFPLRTGVGATVSALAQET
jgi:nucleoside-diphosphate-sugar epimerase